MVNLRVIAGTARGTKLHCPEGLSVRPTHDRVKEAVFSMLYDNVCGAQVLDLFAGTGALGIEALSRGAEHAVFVDSSALSIKTVADNLQKAHVAARAELMQTDFAAYLAATDKTFDLIFLDPPYAKDYLAQILCSICERKLLAKDGIIYCEFEADTPFTPPENLFRVVRDKKYGRARVLLLKELSI